MEKGATCQSVENVFSWVVGNRTTSFCNTPLQIHLEPQNGVHLPKMIPPKDKIVGCSNFICREMRNPTEEEDQEAASVKGPPWRWKPSEPFLPQAEAFGHAVENLSPTLRWK